MMRIKTILICLVLGLIFSFSSFAADGQLSFSDPSGNVGDQISLLMKIRSDTALSRADISLRYDGNALQFVSGTDTDGGAGTLRVHGSGEQGENNTLAFTLQFKVLSQGSSTVSVEKQEVYSADESLLNLTHVGTATVTASSGESTSQTEAESTSESATAEEKQETVNEGVKLSAKDKSITIMNPGSDVQIPEGFLESTIDIDGHQVKGWVWKAEKEHQYIIVYGMNDAGDLNFYRYDLKEKTIQRYFQDPLEEEQKKNAETYPELLKKYDSLVGRYNLQFILSCIFGFVSLLLLVLASFLWQSGKRLKRIIAFQKENMGVTKKELRPDVEGISLREDLPFSGEEEREIEQTKLLSSLEKPSIKDDLEEEDLGATKAIPLKHENKKEKEVREVMEEEEAKGEKEAKEEKEDKEESELEIEDL